MSTSPRSLTRRQALSSAAALCGIAALAAGISPAQAAGPASPSAETLPDGRVKVPLSQLDTVGDVVVVEVRGQRVAAVRVSRSALRALVLSCTHQGAAVNPQGKGFACSATGAGHGSLFRRNGTVSRGPAGSPLRRLPTEKRGGFLLIG